MSEEDIKRIREMMEFLAKQKILEKLDKLSSLEREIYDLTGVKTQREISKTLRTGPHKVITLWKKLECEGILIKEGKGYRKVV